MKMGYRMKTTSRRDYLQRIYSRYRRAAQSMKRHILDEFCANCGYDRKYAIRLLNGPPPGAKPVLQPRRRRVVSYSARVISILKAVWESGGLSLVGAPEGPTAPVDALDSASLSAHAEDGRTTAAHQRWWHRLPPRSAQAAPSLEPAETADSVKDRPLGCSDARIHRDRLGVPRGGFCRRRLPPFAEPDRHPQRLGGDPGRVGKRPGRCAPGAGGHTPGLAVSSARYRFRQCLRIHQCTSLPLLPVACHPVHTRPPLQKG